MSLDISLTAVRRVQIYDVNITHNLTKMADEAGIYKHLWRPEEIGIKTADQLIEPLERGLKDLKSNPDHFKQFEPTNLWGTYAGFVNFVEQYLHECKTNPDAEISVWR